MANPVALGFRDVVRRSVNAWPWALLVAASIAFPPALGWTVWDKLLGLNLFPAEVAQKELAFYNTKLNTYGLPLDNRKSYTKLDWTVWTATLAKDKAMFEKLIAPLEKFWTESPNRVPLTDVLGSGNSPGRY